MIARSNLSLFFILSDIRSEAGLRTANQGSEHPISFAVFRVHPAANATHVTIWVRLRCCGLNAGSGGRDRRSFGGHGSRCRGDGLTHTHVQRDLGSAINTAARC